MKSKQHFKNGNAFLTNHLQNQKYRNSYECDEILSLLNNLP